MRGTQEEGVELLEAREDTAETFEPVEQTFDLVALFVDGVIVVPGMQPIGLPRHYRNHARIEHQLPGFSAFVSAIWDCV